TVDQPTPAEAHAPQSNRIAIGTPLDVRIECADLPFDAVVIRQEWNGEKVRFHFKFTPTNALLDKILNVRVNIYAYGEIANIYPCKIAIVTGDTNPLIDVSRTLNEVKTRLYRKIFISYAREDAEIADLY